MYSTTITIGRNVGDEPMSDDDWTIYRQEMRYLVVDAFGYKIAAEWHDGVGEWYGIQEDSYKVTALTEQAPTAEQLNYLRGRLSRYAGQFHQDAIALTLGHSELISAPPTESEEWAAAQRPGLTGRW